MMVCTEPLPKEVTPMTVARLIVLQRTGHDFGGRGRAFVDQHDDGLAVREVAAARIVALRVLGLAAAGGNDFAAGEEIVGDRDRLIQQAARIVAQIEHIAPEPGADLLLQIVQWPSSGRRRSSR